MMQETGLTKKRSQFGFFWHQFKKNKGALISLIVFLGIVLIALISPLVWDYETEVIGMNSSQRLISPCLEHPFGTDHMGRDVFARVCYGARYSLVIGILAVLISTVFGVFLGSVAGFYGGKVEWIIMRIVEMMLMLPSLMLAIIIVALFGVNLSNLIIALGVSTIPHFARNARASVMTVCGKEYIEASAAIGEPKLKILLKHVIPNAMSPMIVQATTRLGGCIVTASSFSFLGLGVMAPTPEWGAMLSDARSYMWEYPYLVFFPGLAIFITVLCINLIGDGVRDALDPKLKR